MIAKAQQVIAAFHTGAPASNAKLRVVYFHPSDRDPLPQYEERLDRVLTDVSEFYRDGLRRFGIASEGLPLEKKDGRLVLHMVKGKLPASGYRYESGNATAAEIREALRGSVDMDREHVLVLYGLCRKEPDGRYVFDAPYYGGGSQRAGLCHAADCELLDPSLLTDTTGKIVYTEHYYPRVEQTIAKFNSMYLGGIAHELGHGLGLPHDAGSVAEKTFGISLMGSGNLTYRQERWGGGPPAFLPRASALQFASHPFVTGTDQGRWDSPGGKFESLRFAADGRTLNVRGTVDGKIPVYGVIGYVVPTTEKTDHRARTYPALAPDGGFELALVDLRPGQYHLNLAALHVNGATSAHKLQFTVGADGVPKVDQLNDLWITQRAEGAVMRREAIAGSFLTAEAIAEAHTPDVQRKLKTLRDVLNPPTPTDLRSSDAHEVFLSDAAWKSAKVGWGEVARNHFWFDRRFRTASFSPWQDSSTRKASTRIPPPSLFMIWTKSGKHSVPPSD